MKKFARIDTNIETVEKDGEKMNLETKTLCVKLPHVPKKVKIVAGAVTGAAVAVAGAVLVHKIGAGKEVAEIGEGLLESGEIDDLSDDAVDIVDEATDVINEATEVVEEA